MITHFEQYKHLLTGKNIITGLAGIFALLSIENVALWFRAMGHPATASWIAGLAIGSALVILAHQLSGVSYRDGKAFWGLLGVTLVLVALSAGISGNVYAKHLGWFGYVMAFVIAVTGEIALPMAHGWYEESQRNKAVVNAGIIAEQRAAQTLIDTFADLDTSRAKRAAEKRIEQLIVANVDDIVKRLMPTVTPSPSTMDTQTVQMDAHSVTPAQVDVNADHAHADAQNDPQASTDTPKHTFGPHNLDTVHTQRNTQTDARRAQLLSILTDQYNGADAGDLNKTALARALDTSRQTVNRDIDSLIECGRISMNGVVKVVT